MNVMSEGGAMIHNLLVRKVRYTAVSTLWLLGLPLTSVLAQPTLQITSPADGTTVSPGQSLIVNVATSGGAFQQIMIIGQNPIGFSQAIATPPYQFTIQIPNGISPRKYMLTAVGATAPGQMTSSDSIGITVERSANGSSLRVEPSALRLPIGQQG
jgi:hypothetical protein